jgi:ribonuclease HI
METKIKQAKLYTDGGSRGNPGESACAFVICKMDDTVVEKSGFYLGIATNNQAEYKALVAGLERANQLGVQNLQVYMDSELVVKQLKGQYKVKHPGLYPIFTEAKQAANTFNNLSFIHVPRALNHLADAEVNRILDEKL